jgi:hypothetical protein
MSGRLKEAENKALTKEMTTFAASAGFQPPERRLETELRPQTSESYAKPVDIEEGLRGQNQLAAVFCQSLITVRE